MTVIIKKDDCCFYLFPGTFPSQQRLTIVDVHIINSLLLSNVSVIFFQTKFMPIGALR